MPNPDWWISTGEMSSSRMAMPFNAGGPREYTKKYKVICAHKLDGPQLACFAPGIPAPYSPYVSKREWDIYARSIRTKAVQVDDAENLAHYEVTVDYSTDIPRGGIPENFGYPSNGQQGNQGPQNNPELEPPEISWEYEEVKKTGLTDLDGKPFQNSALMPFNPPPPIEGCRPILVVTRNDLSFDALKAATYANTANSTTIGGRLPGTLLCLPPKAVAKYLGPLSYASVTYRIKFGMDDGVRFIQKKDPVTGVITYDTETRFEDFRFHEELDQGTHELLPLLNAAGEHVPLPVAPGSIVLKKQWRWVPIKDQKLTNVGKPVLLDGFGEKLFLEFDEETGVPKPQKPVYLKFRIRKETDFKDFLKTGF